MGKTATSEGKLRRFSKLISKKEVADYSGGLTLGVDLGTANIVLAVADEAGQPVAGALSHSTVVKDGIVVDWAGAVNAVKELKKQLEERLGVEFESANVAIPPGVIEGTVRIFENVIESSGMEVSEIVDEPVAAARFLGIRSGTVIDIGHGTTGVSVIKDSQVVLSIDEPTGGHHLSLVLAGSLGLSYEKAEDFKKAPKNSEQVSAICMPTLEKMAHIAKNAVDVRTVEPVYVVGGSAMLPVVPKVFSDVLGLEVKRPENAIWITPLGLAMKGETHA